jgi:hypothetical protein
VDILITYFTVQDTVRIKLQYSIGQSIENSQYSTEQGTDNYNYSAGKVTDQYSARTRFRKFFSTVRDNFQIIVKCRTTDKTSGQYRTRIR